MSSLNDQRSPTQADGSVNEAADTVKAFTRIELRVVIAIIVILAAMVVPALSKAKAKAQGIQSKSSLLTLPERADKDSQ